MIFQSKSLSSIWGLGLLLALLGFLGWVAQESWGITPFPEKAEFQEKEKSPERALSEVNDSSILAWARTTYTPAKQLQIRVAVTLLAGQCKQAGNLKVSLLDADKTWLAEGLVDYQPENRTQSVAVDIVSLKLPASIKVQGPDGFSREVAFAQVKVVKPHEISATLPRELASGSQFDLRIAVRAVQSFTRTFALAGSRVELELTKKEKTWNLGTYYCGADGVLHRQMRLPDVEPGDYKLAVKVGHVLSGETLERPVKITQDAKILLTTDKPLYQPGQEIHMRALVLSAFDLKPAAKATLDFEVEDGKSNKVFRKSVTTTEQGIAHADFVLASEVNQGAYRIRALTLGKKSEKVVRVEPYVLPRFKLALKGDKSFYLPKETIKGTLQADYVFGKPLAGAKVKISASTSDVAERAFQSWEGKTDKSGLATFEIAIPDYLVGLPVTKGDAVVRLEAEVIDTADHAEKTQKSFPVSKSPLQVTAIAQGGHLVPGVENRIYAAVITPDGKPVAGAEVSLRKEMAITKAITNESGVALLVFTPKASDFQPGDYKQTIAERIDSPQSFPQMRQEFNWSGKIIAQLPSGEKSEVDFQSKANSSAQGLILQTDRAVYLPGQKLRLQVHSTSAVPSAHIDLIREGQSILTDTITMKEGKGELALDLPPDAGGTLEVHAWQVQFNGELLRDGRVVYAQPGNELQIRIETDRDTFRPGETAQLQFQLSDRSGKPQAGALGVIVVDEAVYQLQEIQPGLEKVFFTLREELLKPQAQVLKTTDDIAELVRPRAFPENKQLVAGALFAAFQPKKPPIHQIDAGAARMMAVAPKIGVIGRITANAVAYEEKSFGKYISVQRGAILFAQDLLGNLVKEQRLSPGYLSNPMGGELTLEDLEEIEPRFTASRLVEAATLMRMATTVEALRVTSIRLGNKLDLAKLNLQGAFRQDSRWDKEFICRDLYGRLFRLEKAIPGRPATVPYPFLEGWELVSAGPDGRFGTADDLRFCESLSDSVRNAERGVPWQTVYGRGGPRGYPMGGAGEGGTFFGFYGGAIPGGNIGAVGGGGFPGGMPMGGNPEFRQKMTMRKAAQVSDAAGDLPSPSRNKAMVEYKKDEKKSESPRAEMLSADKGPAPGADTAAEPIRLREFFPETLLWQPALITDDKGRATLKVPLADSITTWRLSASASTASGALGSSEKSFRVFQDFFVEPDLPRFLTQKDELTFSVTLYNYLEQPQTIRLKLLDADWFERLEGAADREVPLAPNQVLGAKYRIRALKNGTFPLEIEARGTKLSDRVRRQVEVLPYGQKIETASTKALAGTWKESISIPKDAVEGASSVQVKIYPGVFSQLVEGMDSILRMPGGCFEQTSSSAYPNLLVMQYIKRNGLVTPAIQMKAESYLNAGYQRLLTFERPGGGFDWWGRDEPVLWLSAYGLMEFSDMAQVWPIDHGVIDRTKAWLLKQRAADGTWSKIGATHGESIERMGDPRLLMTSYVCWALLESGLKPAEIKTSLDFLRKEVAGVESPYVLALAANALVRADSNDAVAAALLDNVLSKLEGMCERESNSEASFLPARGGQSLTYARGNSLQVETTALATLALLESKSRPRTVNQLLSYLVKSKDAHGTWGSTQATVLALKALVGASAMKEIKDNVDFKILVDGKEAAKGRVDATNSDLLQAFDLKSFLKSGGDHEIAIESNRDTAMQVQVATRYYSPWKPEASPVSQAFELKVEYDRAQLAVGDTIKAKATLKYLGKEPTAMVMLDLGIAPGFQPDAAEFAAMVEAGKLKKFSLTDRQAILYLQDVSPGRDYIFEYSLKVKYPVKAKSLPAAAWEYYTPDRRVEAKPTAFEVTPTRSQKLGPKATLGAP